MLGTDSEHLARRIEGTRKTYLPVSELGRFVGPLAGSMSTSEDLSIGNGDEGGGDVSRSTTLELINRHGD